MNISNEKITVIMGTVTDEKVISIMKGTYPTYRNRIEKTVERIAADIYKAKLNDHLTVMATVTELTKSGMYSQITTFNINM